jgi:ribosome-interacting GTPase 1
MPANLTPDYLAAEARFRAAQTDEDKLEALEEMYAKIPKHKGTDHLQGDIKRRISKLREKAKQSTKHSKHADEFYVPKEGAGQIALIGPPNSGKSALLAALTSAHPVVADYHGTTRIPLPGMMQYEDILIQLVDTPPIVAETTERALTAMVRATDAAAIVLDLSDDALLDHLEVVREELARSRTLLFGGNAERPETEVGTFAKKAIIVANKTDLPGAEENLSVLRDLYGNEFDILPVSAASGDGLEELRSALFRVLGVVRVYTKMPGKPLDKQKPFTLKRGSTLTDLATVVHHDFVERLRFARAWGKGILDGAQIGRDHVLEDGYVVELHA